MEMALAIPVILLIVLAMIQFSFLFLIQTSMINAAREAVRRIVAAELTLAEGETVAKNLLVGAGSAYTVNGIENAESVAITVEIPLANVSFLPGFAEYFMDSNLSAYVVMRKYSSL